MPLVLASFGERWHLAAARHIHQVAAGGSAVTSEPEQTSHRALGCPHPGCEQLSLWQKSLGGHLEFIPWGAQRAWGFFYRILVTFSQFNSQSLSSLNLDCAYCKIYLRHTLYKPLWWNNCTYVPLLWWTIIAYGLLLTSMWLSSLVWLVSTVYSQWKWGEVFYFDFSCGLSKYTGCRWSGFFRRQIKWNSFSAPWQDLWPSWYKVANSLCVFY